ncbi:MAG: tRNA pseudouridine(13) synthase TruD, partial [Gammaproteobacteria bacterium]|nr:tRNA pseudouridine(13) synthase TruD [Gammaproteobacteria bacterium]
ALPEEIQILSRTRGRKKLKTGAVASNDFVVRLYVSAVDKAALDARLQQIREQGYPNYFGQQRFGLQGQNVEKLIAMAKGKRCKPQQRSIYLSAGRSQLFNLMLSARVRENNWNQLQIGDVALLNNSRSFFSVTEVNDELQQRLDTFDIHPALPLYGKGDWPSAGDQYALEQKVYAENREIVQALDKFKVELMPRASRVIARELSWDINDEYVELSFTLPSGAYATSLLEQLFELHEPERNSA